MKPQPITIKDIAKALNVSASTVSRALKDYPGISPETRNKVKELAQQLNYKPNALALSLRKSKSFTLGVIIPDVVHFFFSTVISGIEEVANANGYSVILCQSNENFEKEKKMIETMTSNQIDGLLVSHSRETRTFEHFQELVDAGFPIVFFDRMPKMDKTVNVIVDDLSGAYNAVQHLLGQGYKDILHLAGPQNLGISEEREGGYRKALQEAGIPVAENRIIPCPEGTLQESYKICLEIFEELPFPDAVFAANDMAAAGAMEAIKELKIKIPEEVGVVGFSDWQFCSLIVPPLSSVSQPGFEIGKKSTNLILEMINTEGFLPKTEILHTELIIRASSQKKLNFK